MEAGTLRDGIPEAGLPAERWLTLALQLTGALAVAHEHGIIHRDLKPTNIVLAEDGSAKILDFGLAKPHVDPAGAGDAAEVSTRYATEEGAVVGTVAYMSPEQLRELDVDTRSDPSRSAWCTPLWPAPPAPADTVTGRASLPQCEPAHGGRGDGRQREPRADGAKGFARREQHRRRVGRPAEYLRGATRAAPTDRGPDRPVTNGPAAWTPSWFVRGWSLAARAC